MKRANFISHFSVRKIFHNQLGLFHINEVDISLKTSASIMYVKPTKKHLHLASVFSIINLIFGIIYILNLKVIFIFKTQIYNLHFSLNKEK